MMTHSAHSQHTYTLVVRQQPSKARLCSFKEKVDRRPIDPPPIVQLSGNTDNDDFLQNPYFFLYATLVDASGDTDLHFVNGNLTTAGTVVQSLHRLKDLDNTEGGFFIFPDVSVRLEGFYRLRFTLYEIVGMTINRMCTTLSNVFQVYSPKRFPGMSESTFLTRSFSDQGVRIRIRKEPRTSATCGSKRRRSADESDGTPPSEDRNSGEHKSYYNSRSTSPNSELTKFDRFNSPPLVSSPPKELPRSSAMSMQNILSPEDSKSDSIFYTRKLPPPSQLEKASPSNNIPPPPPSTSSNTSSSRWSPPQHPIHYQQQHHPYSRPPH